MSGVLLDLGRMEYGEAWELQKTLAEQRARGEVPDTLVLVEHDHVITLGRKTTPVNFRPQDVPVFQVERGGDATYHGPGQLVGYPIVLLADHDIRRLEIVGDVRLVTQEMDRAAQPRVRRRHELGDFLRRRQAGVCGN
jgi:lipoate-protein ligase B